MPFSAVMLLVIGLTVWLFGSRSAEDLFFGFMIGHAMFYPLGFIGGVLFGNVGPTDSNYSMGNFLATRPLTDADLARAILQTAIKSFLLAWSVWAAAFLVACACLAATGASAVIKLPTDIHWWHAPIGVLAPWAIIAMITSLGLMGHSKRGMLLLCAAVTAFICLSLASKFALRPAVQTIVEESVLAIVGLTILIGGIWAFAAAWRRRYIGTRTVWAAAIAWVAAFSVAVPVGPNGVSQQYLGYLVFAAFLMLVIASGRSGTPRPRGKPPSLIGRHPKRAHFCPPYLPLSHQPCRVVKSSQ